MKVIELECPKCSQKLSFDSAQMGTRQRCTSCGKRFVLPQFMPEELQKLTRTSSKNQHSSDNPSAAPSLEKGTLHIYLPKRRDPQLPSELSRLKGRAESERPKSSPILDSNVPLFRAANTEPVVVSHALWKSLFIQFWKPVLFGFIGLIGVFIVYLFVMNDYNRAQKEGISQLQASKNTRPRDITQIIKPAALNTDDTTAIAEPIQKQDTARAAIQIVKDFLQAETLDAKLAFVTDQNLVLQIFDRHYDSSKVGPITYRNVTCNRQEKEISGQTRYLVDIKLFDFSTRTYSVLEKDGQLKIDIADARALLP